ncbi:hypothetical protein [Mucilaginibacter sp. dw_454]|uniref:hypothetical protein n=1 Tax=Mucilaginibacter sp. dw_454 TaxID=2720079 RepID=UPI001BD2E064|nr:hypothetical protein [Mucilaginibacter sp. dw_454]
MKNKRNVLPCLIILLTGVIYFTVQAQQKKSVNRANFSGEWKFNKSKSQLVEQFPLCIFGNDRMRSKTMKIIGYKDFLTVEVESLSPDGALVTNQQKLMFDGKKREATYVGNPRDESTARWSDDGRTMTVNSARTMTNPVSPLHTFNTNVEAEAIKVTEVWTLINDGKSMAVQVKSHSNSGGNSMTLVYDKQQAADYRF